MVIQNQDSNHLKTTKLFANKNSKKFIIIYVYLDIQVSPKLDKKTHHQHHDSRLE